MPAPAQDRRQVRDHVGRAGIFDEDEQLRWLAGNAHDAEPTP